MPTIGSWLPFHPSTFPPKSPSPSSSCPFKSIVALVGPECEEPSAPGTGDFALFVQGSRVSRRSGDLAPMWRDREGMASIWLADGRAGDMSLAIYFALGFGVMRFLLDSVVFQRVAIKVLCNGVTPLKIDETKRAKVAKFSESMWKLIYYVGVESWVLSILYEEPWSRDTLQYFNDWPNHDLKVSLKYFYMCQCGFYIYSIAALLTWETRRKDFSIMMSHHIITTILIAYSFSARCFRIGSIILALHDACDVFLEAAKLFKYSEIELGASIFFGLFALSWFLLRLIFFPFWVIRASSYHSLPFLSQDKNFILLYYGFNTMLLMLLVFHIYWWILIYLMIMRQLKNRGKVGEDIRSDSDDD